MQLIELQMQRVREAADEAWRAPADQAGEARRHEAQVLVSACIGQWESVKDLLAAFPPHDRATKRDAANMLRTCEQAFASVIAFADRAADGHQLRSIDRLRANLGEVRRMIVLPLARQMAARDPAGRTPDALADHIVQRAEFSTGRPVLTEEITAELPCPYDPEPEAAA